MWYNRTTSLLEPFNRGENIVAELTDSADFNLTAIHHQQKTDSIWRVLLLLVVVVLYVDDLVHQQPPIFIAAVIKVTPIANRHTSIHSSF